MVQMRQIILVAASTSMVVTSPLARAEQSSRPPAPASAKAGSAPPSLTILFDLGSSKVRDQDKAILDRASRAYNEGKPIIMMVVGSSDLSGDAKRNLLLSQRRAAAVLQGLLDRGIPAERFQLVAKGQTEVAVPTAEGVREAANRRVVISWR